MGAGRVCRVLPLVGLAALAAAAGWADPPGARVGAESGPRARPAEERRCAGEGAVCVGRADYLGDVCRGIAAAAGAHGLDPGFFARLVWRESLFDAAAVSPAGAQGIAQFMPATAARRGLADPFDPAQALVASAAYLADLIAAYGNVGLAAAAYNGGEARVERFKAGRGGLALETRAYVHAITGHPAEIWRDAPPASVDLGLGGEDGFEAACLRLAATRGTGAAPETEPLLPWGAIIASNRTREGAERQAARLRNRHAAVLGGEDVDYGRARLPGMPARLHLAQVGRESRAEAEALCARLRAAGGDCMVLKN